MTLTQNASDVAGMIATLSCSDSLTRGQRREKLLSLYHMSVFCHGPFIISLGTIGNLIQKQISGQVDHFSQVIIAFSDHLLKRGHQTKCISYCTEKKQILSHKANYDWMRY